jgi:hypothetical protein
LIIPVTVGEKLTPTVHFADAASGPPHGVVPLRVAAKFPLARKLEIVSEAPVLLVTVTIFAELVVPTALMKLTLLGEKVREPLPPPEPLPESGILTGLKRPP